MAQINTIRSDGDIEFIKSVFGEDYFESTVYRDLRLAQRVNAQREANVAVLKGFDEFCLEHGIKYFLFGRSLAGAVAYEDFLPKDYEVEVGMIRAEYDRFVATYKVCKAQAEEQGWYFDTHLPYDSFAYADDVQPHVTAIELHDVKYRGETVFGRGSLPSQVRGDFYLTVFEEVPDDFFTKKKFFRQVYRRNTAMSRSMNVRKLREDKVLHNNTFMGRRYFGNLKWRYKFVPIGLTSWSLHHLTKRYAGRGMGQVARLAGSRSAVVPLEYFGQYKRMSFAGIEVWTPEKPDIWAREPIFETTPELRRLQERAKEIVVEIDRICKELGIQYFACGGTMLGYVRHGGFIPWDDDIDVGMLRADYEIFKAKAGDLIDKDRFFLQTRETDPKIPYLFSKVRMNDTNYITDYNKFRDFHKGICVDVFPFDYIPNKAEEQREFCGFVRNVAAKHNRVVNRQYPVAQQKENPTDRKGLDWLIGQINGKLLAHHYWGIDLKDTQAAFDEAAQTYDAQAEELGLKYVACFVPTYTMARVDDLFPTQRVNFDGIEINLPKEPEKFLEMQYGNYMVPPAPHQRSGHDLLLWSDAEGIGGGREADADVEAAETTPAEGEATIEQQG